MMKQLLTFSLVVLFSCSAAAQENNVLTHIRMDSLIKKWMADTHTPGLAIGVLKRGHLAKIKTYGIADVESGAPLTDESVFMIASLSKQFISFAILLLEQENRLSLQDPAVKYITELPDPLNKMTIYQLLTHTSGLVRDPENYHPYDRQAIMDVIKSMYTIPLNAQPGDKWLYSNAGYFILAEIITRVSGSPWDTFIINKLFIPANMTKTRTGTVSEIIPGRVAGYNYTKQGLVNTEKWIAVRPSGAFVSTINDMVKWDNFLDTTHLLSPERKSLLWKPARLNNGVLLNYALGWYAEPFVGTTRIHHDGQYPGFRSDYERFPDEGLTLIILSNLDNGPLESLAIKAAGILNPKLTLPPFNIRVKVPEKVAAGDLKIPIDITIVDEGKDIVNSLIEMEIWDESGKSVYKQHAEGLNFSSAEPKQLLFSWSPQKAGRYTVNIGVYGSRWAFSYAWMTNLVTIKVQ
ncbi:serine hydrolase domain-containing protein [Pedobacter heparinus]|uniref:Beta-lactamase n=1 Tax=Pedobacter heparinus (strain ATCC 13125 / DSM 2366 / CIP 104194 / JCM 7457 / NBRC 12017 / NCIMB 9290 / NRRL B-14731 / HIM 762-3) TaxID=485917 RepID=C6Y2F6_PEDHD|nr:serine hydrolase domain-containing protein [Pedobacter heparinus]ACU05166.1 beta-lactamase [Pedobacter heparinus DSM 2366]